MEMKQAEELSSSDEDYAENNIQNVDKNPNLWGKSDKRDHVIGKMRWERKQASKIKAIEDNLSHEEKVLLINEFTSSMFNNFLQGKDDFNYRWVHNFIGQWADEPESSGPNKNPHLSLKKNKIK